MEAPGVGTVTEWVVEEDAWRVLPISPPGAFVKRGVFWRAGDDVRRDDGVTARGQAPSTEFPLLSLPVRDASRRRRPLRRRGDGTRPGAIDGVSPLLAPSQGCEQETTMVVSAGHGSGTLKPEECFRPGRPSAGSPMNSFPRIELGAPP